MHGPEGTTVDGRRPPVAMTGQTAGLRSHTGRPMVHNHLCKAVGSSVQLSPRQIRVVGRIGCGSTTPPGAPGATDAFFPSCFDEFRTFSTKRVTIGVQNERAQL